MTTPQEARWQAKYHVYLLVDESGQRFRLGTATSPSGRKTVLRSGKLNLDASLAAGFADYNQYKSTATDLRKAAQPYDIGTVDRLKWYDIQGLAPLTALLRSRQAPTGFFFDSARSVFPASEEEASAAVAAENAYWQRLAEENNRRFVASQAEQERARAELRRQVLEAERQSMQQDIREGYWLSPTHAPDDVLQRLCADLMELNALSNGYCKRESAKGGQTVLDVWVTEAALPYLHLARMKLARIVGFEGAPPDLDDPALLARGIRPFGEVHQPDFPRRKPGMHHFVFRLPAQDSFLGQVLSSLTPGIRGWDVPLATRVMGYDPEEKAKALAPWRELSEEDQARRLWNGADRTPSPEAKRLTEQRGLRPGWAAPAVRYHPASPYPEDQAAPLLLLRITNCYGHFRGVQLHNLVSGGTRLLMASQDEAGGLAIRLWSDKPILLAATELADALALNRLSHGPVVILPQPALAEQFVIPNQTARLVFGLPTEEGPWSAALQSLQARCAAAGVPFLALRPRQEVTTDPEGAWPAFVAANPVLEKALAKCDRVLESGSAPA